ncbi:hypothetical protein SCALM49S_01557 [Streptomyces californicus]
MSSRSNGVMKEEFSWWKIAWVASSPACSAARIRSAISTREAESAPSSSIRSFEPVTMLSADAENMS